MHAKKKQLSQKSINNKMFDKYLQGWWLNFLTSIGIWVLERASALAPTSLKGVEFNIIFVFYLRSLWCIFFYSVINDRCCWPLVTKKSLISIKSSQFNGSHRKIWELALSKLALWSLSPSTANAVLISVINNSFSQSFGLRSDFSRRHRI